jgi:hypothetical protein
MANADVLDKPDTQNVLNMSDEDMLKFDPSTLVSAEETTVDADTTVVTDNVADDAEDKADDAGVVTPDAAKDDEDDVDPENPDADPVTPQPDESKDEAKRESEDEVGDKADEKPVDKKEESKEDTSAVDFEANWKELTKPFKANGRDMQIDSVEDARALMQMGANYNKKMAALKPNLKIMKLLENNGLLSEEKLSFLIDLDKKNPDAIGKLIKDSGIDPMDLDADKASGYKPNTYTVDDRELELDSVLESLVDSPAYTQTLDVVSNKWDSASKQVISKTPALLQVINTHIELGIYDVINRELDRERMLGRLNGLSDIEAYRQVGDAIEARGGFAHLQNKDAKPTPKPVVVVPKPKQDDDDKLKEKKRAASSTKPVAPSAKASDFNPLSLSDEEFSKQVNGKFL